MMIRTIFEGKKHKITTVNRTFFLYTKILGNKWELRDSNSLDDEMYKEALRDIKTIVSMKITDEEKMLKICESGFFRISNL